MSRAVYSAGNPCLEILLYDPVTYYVPTRYFSKYIFKYVIE